MTEKNLELIARSRLRQLAMRAGLRAFSMAVIEKVTPAPRANTTAYDQRAAENAAAELNATRDAIVRGIAGA